MFGGLFDKLNVFLLITLNRDVQDTDLFQQSLLLAVPMLFWSLPPEFMASPFVWLSCTSAMETFGISLTWSPLASAKAL